MPVVHELRGVGKNMQDHYVARVSYPVVGAQTANERSRGLPLAGEVMRWLFTGKGMLTYSPSIVAASVKVLEELATPDVQVTFAPGSFKGRPDRRTRGDARASAPAPGRCGPCRAAMSRPNRTGRATRRRSTRAICRKKATAARSLAACAWPGGSSPPRHCSASSAKKPCPAPSSRPTTNCSTTRGAMAAPAITPAAPA